ncbi:MAG: hypothetical protein EB060_00350 [Proteobacteria bacterium]|nr:hypothetical protein [Pseudomonadota bacterium]
MKRIFSLILLSACLISCKAHNMSQNERGSNFVAASKTFEPGKKYIDDCPAAQREKAMIDTSVYPTATFSIITVETGSEKGKDGKLVTLYTHQAVDTADIENNTKLEIYSGGCEAYGNTYAFIMPAVKTKTSDTKFWYKKSADLIAQISKGVKPEGIGLPELESALRKESEAKKPEKLGEQVMIEKGLYGIGDRGARVDVEQKGDKTVLKITHSVSL